MAQIRLPILTKEQIFHQLLEAIEKELRLRVRPLININQEWEKTKDIVCEWDASIYEERLDQQNHRNTYQTPQSKPQSQHRPRNNFQQRKNLNNKPWTQQRSQWQPLRQPMNGSMTWNSNPKRQQSRQERNSYRNQNQQSN